MQRLFTWGLLHLNRIVGRASMRIVLGLILNYLTMDNLWHHIHICHVSVDFINMVHIGREVVQAVLISTEISSTTATSASTFLVSKVS